jgi:hypothetical protein
VAVCPTVILVHNDGDTGYVFVDDAGTETQVNAELTLTPGTTYEFDVDAPGHPFILGHFAGDVAQPLGPEDGVQNNAVDDGIVTYTVPLTMTSTVQGRFYICQLHEQMQGIITFDTSNDPDTDCVQTMTVGACSKTCGVGTAPVTYEVTTPQSGQGAACATTETQECIEEDCPPPVDCVGAFGEMSACSADCGGGTQSRTYTITTEAAHGGAECLDPTGTGLPLKTGDTDTQACNAHACAPVDCVGEYDTDFSVCSETCGDGTQTKSFVVTTAPSGGGTACPADETQACNGTCLHCPTCRTHSRTRTHTHTHTRTFLRTYTRAHTRTDAPQTHTRSHSHAHTHTRPFHV